MAAARNILLINPWIYDFTAYDFWMKPLGLLYVAALLGKHSDCRLSFVDCLDRFHPGLAGRRVMKPDGRGPFPKETVEKPALLKDVPRRFSRYGIPPALFEEELSRVPRPDAVLLTCTMTYWYPGVQAVIEIVRRRFGAVPVILGGIYATLCPSHARAHSGADLVVPGPAERSLLQTLRDVLGDDFGSPPDPAAGFDALPGPDCERLGDKTWLPLLTSRGCPCRCTFCASSLLAPKFEQRSPAAVAEDIEGYYRRYGTRHFAFYDDALLVDRERRIFPLLERIAASSLPLSFHTPNGLHIREIDDRAAKLFRAAGMASLYLSLESADEALIRERSPKTSPGNLEDALGALERAGYSRGEINVYLIAGLPGQSAGGVEESIGFVRGLGAVPRVAYFSPIPGTAEWESLAAQGIVSDGTDPLLHNKIAFAYLRGDSPPDGFERIKRALNRAG